MALDTINKRRSALGMFLPFLAVLPVPDGAMTAGDRLQGFGLYCGFVEQENGAYARTGVLGIGAAVIANQNFGESILGYEDKNSGTAWSGYTTLACANWDVVNAVGGNTSKFFLYGRNTNGSVAAVINVGIYTHNGSTVRPDGLVATAQITIPPNSAEGWFSADISVPLTANATYWIAQIASAFPSGAGIRYFARDANRHIYGSQTSLPNPWPASGTKNTTQWIMYVTYAPSGGNAYERTGALGVGTTAGANLAFTHVSSDFIVSRW